MHPRVTRSKSAEVHTAGQIQSVQRLPPTDAVSTVLRHKTIQFNITYLSKERLGRLLGSVPRADLQLLRKKQSKLQEQHAQVTVFVSECLDRSDSHAKLLAQAAAATLVFTGEAAGTAICISPDGLLLTCAHCIAETEKEYKSGVTRWLLFADGHPVQAKGIAWDPIRDLALLQITVGPSSLSKLPYARLSQQAAKAKARMICIGHPGSEDLETAEAGVATDYDVLHISEGRFRGMAEDQDPQDNSEIGALMHDCWTYWGHSGAPLVSMNSGLLLGLHSSWDNETGMRRGVGLAAIKAFLETSVEEVEGVRKT